MKTHKNLTKKELLHFNNVNAIRFDFNLLTAVVDRILTNTDDPDILNNVYDIIENTIVSLLPLATNENNHESNN